jgi:hypothetical protein
MHESGFPPLSQRLLVNAAPVNPPTATPTTPPSMAPAVARGMLAPELLCANRGEAAKLSAPAMQKARDNERKRRVIAFLRRFGRDGSAAILFSFSRATSVQNVRYFSGKRDMTLQSATTAALPLFASVSPAGERRLPQ